MLLVEDDGDLRDVLDTVLRDRGMEVTPVSDAWQALGMMSGRTWDVVVCDIRLPGPSGFHLAHAAQGQDYPPVVILITAYPDWHVYQQAMEARALCVLRKPFDVIAFSDYVRAAAGLSSSGRPRD